MTIWQDRRDARARLILGVLLEDMGEFEYAAGMFRRASSLSPDSAEPHLRWGLLRWKMGNSSGMYEPFNEAVHLDPLGVRAAVREESEVARLIKLVLYQRQYYLPPPEPRAGAPDRCRGVVRAAGEGGGGRSGGARRGSVGDARRHAA